MKDHVIQLAASKSGPDEKLNAMREYLQAFLLRILYTTGFFRNTAFVGGTALRFLYDLPRFSEDLDFSVSELKKRMPFEALLGKVKSELTLAGYDVSITYKDLKTVQSAFVRFDHLLNETGLSSHKGQKLSIKIEVDTHPPKKAQLETRLVNKYFPIAFLTHDIASLFSGKIHALLCRRYTKGRDFFDLGWYLSTWKNLTPNISMLQEALKQTGWENPAPTEKNWRTLISGQIEKTDWKKVNTDVAPFLERKEDQTIFTKENILNLLKDTR